MRDERDIVPIEARPVEVPPKRPLPPILAKTVNLCVNCVVAPGRMAARMARSRHERHYHARHRFGRHHLAADVGFVVAILALIGINGYLFFVRPSILSSAVKLEWSATPTTVRSGDALTFTLTFRHDGDEPLVDATVALRLPEHFLVQSVVPDAYDAVTHTVRIGALAPGAFGRVAVHGITDAPDGATLRIEGTFHGKGATRSERVVVNGNVEVRGVAVSFAIGPQGDGPAIVRLGQAVEIGASYYAAENDPTPLDARAFRITVSGPLPAKITATVPDAVVRRGEIRWPFRGVRPAGETTGEALLLTPPKSTNSRMDTNDTNSVAYILTPELILAEDAQGIPTARIVGPPLTLEIAGELRVTAAARYFTPEGDQVGRGPLPPRVGQTTKYWVTWDAKNLVRGADQVTVRAALPGGVEWTERMTATDGEAPTFDATSRTVTWAIGKLDRAMSASFELAVTPTAEQTGSFAALLGETTAQGVDDLGTELVATAPAVTTELLGDERAKGKGVVVE